ncbi:MAG: Ig-like domain-containing protein, partial [Muribaculum sp.]|nr:Ig-like domain-containing protein [Muribaculum sp.]
MRKLLLSFLALVGISLAGYAESVTFDFLNNTYGMTRLSGTTQEYNPDGTVVTQDGCPVEIKLTGNTRLWSDGLRCYTSSSLTISASGYVIKSVTFGKNWAKFNYNGSALSAAKWTSAAGEASVVFACNISSKNTPINTLTIEYEQAGDPSKEDAGIKFNQTSFTVEMGDEFTAPELVNPNGLAVTYTSSDEAVATVAADGKVAIVGAGTTVITAKSEETSKYN